MELIRFIALVNSAFRKYQRFTPDAPTADRREFYALLQEKQGEIRASVRTGDVKLEKLLWCEYCGIIAGFLCGELRKGAW